uniref:Uncharacterized protein n=1 Tax=Leersia perrieri TaxID=77586 RepID=A0A0D9VCG7_9ORYZ
MDYPITQNKYGKKAARNEF